MQLHPYILFCNIPNSKAIHPPVNQMCLVKAPDQTPWSHTQKITPGKNHESSERGRLGAECFFSPLGGHKHGYLDTSHFLHPTVKPTPRLVKPQDFPVQLHQAEVLTLKLLLPGYAFVTVSVLWHSKTTRGGEEVEQRSYIWIHMVSI